MRGPLFKIKIRILAIFFTPLILLTIYASVFGPTSTIAMQQSQTLDKKEHELHDIPIHKQETIDGIFHFISEIRLKQKNETPKLLVAFDWDNTISKINGCELPLREENTENIITNIVHQLKAEIIILTSRFNGADAETAGEKAIGESKKMRTALPILSDKTAIPHTLHGLGDFQIPNTKNHVLYHDGVVFAGASNQDHSCSQFGSCKGQALIQLVEGVNIQIGHQDFKKIGFGEFDALIFIDNDEEHLKAVREAFSKHPDREKIHLIHYEQNPILGEESWHLCATVK